MSSLYEEIRFYSSDDKDTVWQVEKSEPLILGFSTRKKPESINEVIELYNVQKLFETRVISSKWTSEKYERLRSITKQFDRTIGEYSSHIRDENFIECVQEVAVNYLDNFWDMFEHYKVYEHISQEIFADYLKAPLSKNKKSLIYEYVTGKKEVPDADA